MRQRRDSLGQQDGGLGTSGLLLGVSSSSVQPDTPASWGSGLRSWGQGAGNSPGPFPALRGQGLGLRYLPVRGAQRGAPDIGSSQFLRWKGGRWLAGWATDRW